MTGSIFLISAFSFLLTLVLTPLVRDTFLRLGMLDRPDGSRKLHRHAVPRVGGISITFAYMASYAVLLMLPAQEGSVLHKELPLITKLLPAAAIIFLTGLLDDVFGLKPWQKLAGQMAGTAVAMMAGVRILGLAGHTVPGPVALLLTSAWLIGCTNAFNLIDGLDGLASGMGLFAILTTFIAALLHGNEMLALATLPMAGCLLGFLRYNFNPASVFLGDSGSLLIGFMLGCYGVIWSQKSATLLGMTAPLMAMAVPLLDTALAVARRWLRGQPIFGADRGHIHHKLLEKGLTHRRVVLLLYLAGSLYAVLSLLQSITTNQYGGVIVVLFCLVTWVGVQHLGYAEFSAVGRVLSGGAVRRALNGQIALHATKTGIAACTDIGQCWQFLRQTSGQFGFSGIQARLNGGSYFHLDAAVDEDDEEYWQLRIPLPNGDFLHLFHSFSTGEQAVVMPLVQMLRQGLEARLPAFAATGPATGEHVHTGVGSLVSLQTSIESFQPASREDVVGTTVSG
ncbi:MAG: undecaprenyl/decaprenyl-phosphate alpha-N-acetylglucosaminyl 1-phosphate transferase [Acidobacteriia bacterium]|nr:undecaprenyl/decaprenyl-phosphate alpha-N-acetylglucosaminyl 1-phosphate transferase [Terriglobia bacterium]